ncbi:MAG: anthranilate phosphoribosyltransferase [Elusimicrobia bacterium]|nr:anthranilate phosphoribosyltransferase [Elusimicrobiota bacterium]
MLEAACRGKSLSRREAAGAMAHLVSGETPEVQVAAFLGALAGRGVTADELTGFAEELRRQGLAISPKREPLVDTCGTGGDGLSTFNFSTAAALVAAGAGAAVAKHGNRAVSSRCGSADVLETLGVPIELAPADAEAAIERTGFAFLLAPRYNPVIGKVGAVRKALGVRTVFNLLGPLVNPARVRRQVVGIFDPALLETYGRVLSSLGAERALVVCAEDGMDELSPAGPARICRVEGGAVSLESFSPEDAGVRRVPAAGLRGAGAAENARALEAVLAGSAGPLLEGTVLNAGAALWAAGLAGSIREGTQSARETLRSGKAAAVLESCRGGA